MSMKNKLIGIALFFLLLPAICWAGGKQDKAQTQSEQTSSQPVQPSTSSTLPYWTGDGGKGIKIAVLEPTGKGLSETEKWMPSMVQGSITGDFQKYSAMTIIDRQNLEKILGEQKQSLSGNYSDNDYISIGKLTNARYILAGSVTKTTSAYMLELAVTDAESGERKASYPPKAVSPFVFENLSAIKEATAELLGQLGVQLTSAGLQELNSAANIAQVKAETALAKGIAAQKQGTVVEALSYFIQAANYDSGLVEAANRMNTLTANISSGNIGEDTRNDIAWRREWVKRLQETETFFANTIKEPQPYYIVYSTDIQKGKIDYQKETIALSIHLSFYPDFTWADHINGVLTAVKNGLQATGRAQVWELDWPLKTISTPSPFGNQTKNSTSTIVVEILNDEGKSIGRQTVKASYGFEIKYTWVMPLLQWEGDVSFPAVDANLITDKLTIRIASIDGIAAENAARQKKISIMPETEWNILLRTNPVIKQNIEVVRLRQIGDEYFKQAKNHENNKNWDLFKTDRERAIVSYSEALKINPNNIYALIGRGEVYLDLGRWYASAYNPYIERAIWDFDAVLRIDPYDAYVLNCRGLAYESRRDRESIKFAIANFEAALKLSPNNPFYKDNLRRVRGW
jgi:tetratricopeptide (TPR) repeat protein